MWPTLNASLTIKKRSSNKNLLQRNVMYVKSTLSGRDTAGTLIG